MASLKKITVPGDGSALSIRAVPVAAAIATAADASMALLSVARHEGSLAAMTKPPSEARHLVLVVPKAQLEPDKALVDAERGEP